MFNANVLLGTFPLAWNRAIIVQFNLKHINLLMMNLKTESRTVTTLKLRYLKKPKKSHSSLLSSDNQLSGSMSEERWSSARHWICLLHNIEYVDLLIGRKYSSPLRPFLWKLSPKGKWRHLLLFWLTSQV